MNRILLDLAVSGSGLALSDAPAWAHSEPESVSPAACTNASIVDQVIVDLSSEASPEGTSLTASIGGQVIATAGIDLSDIDHQRIVMTLPSGAAGRIDMAWATVSAVDGDSASGTYSFGIDTPAALDNCALADAAEASTGSIPVLLLGGGTVLVVLTLGLARRRPSRIG